jgi:hypothetical protein
MPALAATAAEDAMFQAPMPHQLLGGHGAKVHLVRLHGYLYAAQGNAAYLMQLKADMHRCTDTMRELAAPAPSAWLDFIHSIRTDTYASANRTITYRRAVLYSMNPPDCGLHEFVSSTALLTSANGRCDIDSDHSGMMLEMTSQVWATHNAVEVLLDADVDGAVFGPYLSGGYQIRDRGVRK